MIFSATNIAMEHAEENLEIIVIILLLYFGLESPLDSLG